MESQMKKRKTTPIAEIIYQWNFVSRLSYEAVVDFV